MTGKKLRATTLATIMVLSVIAIGIGPIGTAGAAEVNNGPVRDDDVSVGASNVTVMNLTFTSDDVRVANNAQPGEPTAPLNESWYYVDHDQDLFWDTGEETQANPYTNDLKRDETLIFDSNQNQRFEDGEVVQSEDLNDPQQFGDNIYALDIDHGDLDENQSDVFGDYDGEEDLDNDDVGFSLRSLKEEAVFDQRGNYSERDIFGNLIDDVDGDGQTADDVQNFGHQYDRTLLQFDGKVDLDYTDNILVSGNANVTEFAQADNVWAYNDDLSNEAERHYNPGESDFIFYDIGGNASNVGYEAGIDVVLAAGAPGDFEGVTKAQTDKTSNVEQILNGENSNYNVYFLDLNGDGFYNWSEANGGPEPIVSTAKVSMEINSLVNNQNNDIDTKQEAATVVSEEVEPWYFQRNVLGNAGTDSFWFGDELVTYTEPDGDPLPAYAEIVAAAPSPDQVDDRSLVHRGIDADWNETANAAIASTLTFPNNTTLYRPLDRSNAMFLEPEAAPNDSAHRQPYGNNMQYGPYGSYVPGGQGPSEGSPLAVPDEASEGFQGEDDLAAPAWASGVKEVSDPRNGTEAIVQRVLAEGGEFEQNDDRPSPETGGYHITDGSQEPDYFQPIDDRDADGNGILTASEAQDDDMNYRPFPREADPLPSVLQEDHPDTDYNTRPMPDPNEDGNAEQVIANRWEGQRYYASVNDPSIVVEINEIDDCVDEGTDTHFVGLVNQSGTLVNPINACPPGTFQDLPEDQFTRDGVVIKYGNALADITVKNEESLEREDLQAVELWIDNQTAGEQGNNVLSSGDTLLRRNTMFDIEPERTTYTVEFTDLNMLFGDDGAPPKDHLGVKTNQSVTMFVAVDLEKPGDTGDDATGTLKFEVSRYQDLGNTDDSDSIAGPRLYAYDERGLIEQPDIEDDTGLFLESKEDESDFVGTGEGTSQYNEFRLTQDTIPEPDEPSDGFTYSFLQGPNPLDPRDIGVTPGPDIWVDTNNDGSVGFQEVLGVIEAFNQGTGYGPKSQVTFQDVLEAIRLFNEGISEGGGSNDGTDVG